MSPIWRAGRAPERIAVVVTQCRYWRTTVAAMADVLFASPRGDRLRSAVRDGYDGGVLGTIKSQAVSAAVWRRPLPRRLARWLALQTPSQLLEAGIVVRPKFLLDELNQAAEASGLSESRERELFLTDVSGLASRLARILRTPSVDVRLALVDEKSLEAEAMRGNGARLICVYRVATVPLLRMQRKHRVPDWELWDGRLSTPLPTGSVVMLKPRPEPTASRGTVARATRPPEPVHASRKFYMLQVLA